MLRNEFGVTPPRDLTSVSNTRSCYTFVKPYLHTCTHVEEITREQSEITKEQKGRLVRSATIESFWYLDEKSTGQRIKILKSEFPFTIPLLISL